ncbi:type II toxin-antitoxin system PemK/MazF family toxin [Frateuria sp. STR12]|nr:type II toxin-antitoxin system PemK/MazF family toxin [Frateuria sp. STR12]MCX7513772.1 type II toxin-antitoxin system PemK/MazF family toxin [Frateuria sp. STR12]
MDCARPGPWQHARRGASACRGAGQRVQPFAHRIGDRLRAESNLKHAAEPGNVLLDAGEGGLPKQSVVVVSQISAVGKGGLGQSVGALSTARVEQILAGLRFQQAAFLRGR